MCAESLYREAKEPFLVIFSSRGQIKFHRCLIRSKRFRTSDLLSIEARVASEGSDLVRMSFASEQVKIHSLKHLDEILSVVREANPKVRLDVPKKFRQHP